MPPLNDPVIRARIERALALWEVTGYVTWKRVAAEWVRANLENCTAREVARLVAEHTLAGGIVDQVSETRPEWSEHPFHYDWRIVIAGRRIYIETVMLDDDPTDPVIHVVSIHDA